jgi:hypothetical protein
MLAMGIAALMITSAPVALADDPLAGRIVGQLTKSNGEPASGVSVTAVSIGGAHRYSTRTTADGSYVLPDVAGYNGQQYKVEFDPRFSMGLPNQWAHRRKTEAEAEIFPVIPGQDTVVNDALFPTGSVKFTASHAVTGAPITKFCGELQAQSLHHDCTENGVITFSDVAPGNYRTWMYSDPDYFEARSTTSVTAEQVSEVHSKLAPTAKIAVTVVDAKTKAPVENACLYAKSGIGGIGDYVLDCTGADGRVTVTNLTTGTYNMWVQPRDGVHGAQWVGAHGGTGSRALAKAINVTADQTTQLSPILLDGAGSISGTVVDGATGAPVAGVCAFPRAHPGPEDVFDRPYCTKQDGKYTIDGLGPYHWPVEFVDVLGPHAWQWSGDQPSQLTARLIKVRIGQTATENARLAHANTVSGKVTAGTDSRDLTAYNAITGDPVGSYTFPDTNGNYTLTNIAGNQPVKVRYREYRGQPEDYLQWYKDAKDFASARPILVRPGIPVKGIDFTIPAG